MSFLDWMLVSIAVYLAFTPNCPILIPCLDANTYASTRTMAPAMVISYLTAKNIVRHDLKVAKSAMNVLIAVTSLLFLGLIALVLLVDGNTALFNINVGMAYLAVANCTLCLPCYVMALNCKRADGPYGFATWLTKRFTYLMTPIAIFNIILFLGIKCFTYGIGYE